MGDDELPSTVWQRTQTRVYRRSDLNSRPSYVPDTFMRTDTAIHWSSPLRSGTDGSSAWNARTPDRCNPSSTSLLNSCPNWLVKIK